VSFETTTTAVAVAVTHHSSQSVPFLPIAGLIVVAVVILVVITGASRRTGRH